MKKDNNKSNEAILKLYNQGFSCKDISLLYNIPQLKIRHCLQEAGFNTRAYRKLSISNKDKVLLLVKSGYSYKRIEDLLFVSTHAIREIIEENGLVGFAPKYHHPIQLDVQEDLLSMDRIDQLRTSYFAGNSGLARCAVDCSVTDDEFLWFIYHLSDQDKKLHKEQLLRNLMKMHEKKFPAAAIAKAMDISLSLVKKAIKSAV